MTPALQTMASTLRPSSRTDAAHARTDAGSESSHAIAKAMELAATRGPNEIVLVCLSGRGDKDASEIARLKEAMSG